MRVVSRAAEARRPDGSTAPDAPGGHGGSTLLIRRLDWRFMLDEPELGRVAYRGPEPDGGTLRLALEREADSLLPLESADGDTVRPAATGEPVDLVVLRQPGRTDLQDAARALPPGGRLYCEVERAGALRDLFSGAPGAPPEAPARRLVLAGGVGLRGLLRREGFEDLRLHVHHPSFEECREIVPFEAGALALALRRHAARLPAPLRRAGAVAGERLLPAVAPRLSLVATRAPSRSGRRRPEPAAVARPAWSEGVRGRGTPLAVTPRFRSSDHVVVLVPGAEGAGPEVVVKVARSRGPSAALEREAENLRRLHAARDGGIDSVPRLEGTGRAAGRPYLVETGLPGRPMDRSFVRRNPESSIQAVTAWLLDLHRTTAHRGTDPERLLRRLVDAPLDRFADAVELRAEERRLVARTRRLTRPLARHPWPTVFEHGDLSQPNLLLEEERSVGVVDWELGEPEGMPAVDLYFFLAYVAFARSGAASPEACAQAIDRVLLHPDPAERDAIVRYATSLDLPRAILPALLTACWARQTVRLVERVSGAAASAGVGPPPEAVSWLRRHRFLAVWRRVVDAAERGWMAGGAQQ